MTDMNFKKCVHCCAKTHPQTHCDKLKELSFRLKELEERKPDMSAFAMRNSDRIEKLEKEVGLAEKMIDFNIAMAAKTCHLTVRELMQTMVKDLRLIQKNKITTDDVPDGLKYEIAKNVIADYIGNDERAMYHTILEFNDYINDMKDDEQ